MTSHSNTLCALMMTLQGQKSWTHGFMDKVMMGAYVTKLNPSVLTSQKLLFWLTSLAKLVRWHLKHYVSCVLLPLAMASIVDVFLTVKAQSTYYSETSLQVNISCLRSLFPNIYRLMDVILARRVYTVQIIFPGKIVIFSGATEHW